MHSFDADATFWSNQRGEKIFFCHGSNRSGGVTICINRYIMLMYNFLFDFTNSSALIDEWRDRNPDVSLFCWVKSNGSCKSRIDLWLTTPEIVKLVSGVSISSAPSTDHCLIYLVLNPEIRYKKDYLKFNADLLNDEVYVKLVKDLLQKIKKDRYISSHSSRWKFFKSKVRELSLNFS